MKGNKKLSVEFNSNENSDRIFWRYIETHSEKCERKEEGKEYRAPNEMDYIYIYIYIFFFSPSGRRDADEPVNRTQNKPISTWRSDSFPKQYICSDSVAEGMSVTGWGDRWVHTWVAIWAPAPTKVITSVSLSLLIHKQKFVWLL